MTFRRVADDPKRTGKRLSRGYLASCSRCGAMVVHWRDGSVNHAHARSALCKRLFDARIARSLGT